MNFISLSSTLALGMFHALEPGHGKSFLATYLIGRKFSWVGVLRVVLSMMASHFLLLLVLLTVLSLAFGQGRGDSITHAISTYAPLLVIAFGVVMLGRHLYKKRKAKNGKVACGCSHTHLQKEEKSTRKTAVLAGFVGGLIPCPTVLAPIMMAGADANMLNTIWYMLVYLLGMGLILFSIALVFLYAKDKALLYFNRLSNKIDIHLVSYSLIIVVGIVYMLLGMDTGHHGHTH